MVHVLFISLLVCLFIFIFCVLKTLMSEPEEIATMTGQKIPRKCSIGKYCFRIQLLGVCCSSDFIDFVNHCVYSKIRKPA